MSFSVWFSKDLQVGLSLSNASQLHASTFTENSLRFLLPDAPIITPANSMSATESVSAFNDSFSTLSVSNEINTSLPIMAPQTLKETSLILSSGSLWRENERVLGERRDWLNIKLSSLHLVPSSSIQKPDDLVPSMATEMFLIDVDMLLF